MATRVTPIKGLAGATQIEFDTEIWWDLFVQADQIGALVLANTHPGCELNRLFRMTRWDRGDEKKAPTAEILTLALVQFQRLPAHEQRRLLNGWAVPWPVNFLLSWGSELPEYSGRQLTLALEDDGTRVDTISEWESTESESRVRLLIRLGASKSEALAALNRIKKKILSGWDNVIADPHENAQEEAGVTRMLLSRRERWITKRLTFATQEGQRVERKLTQSQKKSGGRR
jgi:hypothetical protein